jgi:hypothetical protein
MSMTPFERLLKFVLDATLWLAFVAVVIFLWIAVVC